VIQLTQNAASAVKSAITKAADPVGGLRIVVEAGGCAGMKYSIGLVPAGKPEDLVVEQDGLKVFVDPTSAPLLSGTTIDYVSSLEGAGFTFSNPQAKESCGCGKSFR
jgi:iron-sulfur cluster assembly protein